MDFYVIIALLLLVVVLGFIAVFIRFIYSIFIQFFPILVFGYGGPFVSSNKKIIEKMISFLGINSGDKAADLGSGDGRLVIALAKAGAEAHGYEINPFLVWLSRKNIEKAGLQGKAFVHRKNIWKTDLSQFNIIAVYGISYMMKKLEAKLKKELKPGSKIVSNYFTFPIWQYSKKEEGVYLYVK